jgi:(p)ppGpp synthase/HD superfamily hydrolase
MGKPVHGAAAEGKSNGGKTNNKKAIGGKVGAETAAFVGILPPQRQRYIAALGEDRPVLAQRGRATALLLHDWGASVDLQSAAALLPFVENGAVTAAETAHHCGERVAYLCGEYLRIMQHPADPQWAGDPLVQQRVRTFVLAYRDPELAFLGVASQWQQVMDGWNAGGAQRRAAEQQIYRSLAPSLDMLGLRTPHIQLGEALDDDEEDEDKPNPDQQRAAAEMCTELAVHLPDAQIFPVTYTFQLAPTKYTQMHNLPSQGNGKAHNRSQHAIDIHVVAADLDACYHALRWVQTLWAPVEAGIIDTLNAPRSSGYRALHAAVGVQLPSGKTRVNFVIAPRAYYEINLWGLGALYLRDRLRSETPGAWWNNSAGYQQIASAPFGSLPEHLYVFSPQGQLLPFDQGSTVVDYAYYVHSDLAEQTRRFVVNGRAVEPSTVLRHLDLVELDHDPRAPGPNRLWLQAARTGRARTAIERYLKRQGQGSHHGQKIIDERLQDLERHYGFSLPAERVEQAMMEAVRRENLGSKDDLLAAIAGGQFAVDRLFHRIFEHEILRQVEIPRGVPLRHHQLRLAQCCRPRPGEDIVGRLYRRHGEVVNLSVHKQACARIAGHPDLTPLRWRLQPNLAKVARIDVRALDDNGLLGALMEEIYVRQPRITIRGVTAAARHGSARIQFDVQVDQAETLEEVAAALRRLPTYSISDVQTLNLPPSEQEKWIDPGAGVLFNPYSRLPVHEDAMFFGRSQERARISECLFTRQPSIWLIGQKRVGKTSLLLQLKDYDLLAQGFTPVFVDFQLMGRIERSNVFYEVASVVYNSLQADPRLGAVGAPLRSLFDEDPARQLIDYLLGVQKLLGARRLVLLMDEFSRLTDAYLDKHVDGAFFDRWRAMMHVTQRAGVGYVVVMQQQTWDTMARQLGDNPDDPSWRLMDVGQRLNLRPLEDEDVRRLVEWPMRNHLTYSPEVVDRIATLTGGSPFLIQAFCHSLVMHVARQRRNQITPEDLDVVGIEFMQPQDHTFAHMTEMLKGIGNNVAATLARLAGEQPDRTVSWARLRSVLPNVPPDSLRTGLRQLTEQDILVQPAQDRWRFASLLFQQWLAVNMY